MKWYAYFKNILIKQKSKNFEYVNCEKAVVYNNKFVDDTDSYRHSKWLSMMNKRLKLAKDLLKPDGCLICAIDKNEFARLFILLEEIFKNKEQMS